MKPPDRIPPHDLEAERALLGLALLDGDTAALVADVDPAVFYTEAHRAIARSIARLVRAERPVDLLTLRDDLERAGDLQTVGGAAALALLLEQAGVAIHATAYLEIVREKASKRALVTLGHRLASDAYDEAGPSAGDLVTAGIGQLLRLQSGSTEIIEAPELFNGAKDAAEEPIPSGLPLLDDLFDGFTPGHLTVLAGRPGMGKTALACQLSHRLTRHDRVPVLFLSLEMPAKEIGARLLSIESGVNSRHIQRGTAPDPARIAQARATLAASPFHIQRARTRQLSDVLTLIRTVVAKHHVRIVFLDHIGKVAIKAAGRRESRYQEISEVCEELKAAAMQLNVPIVALAQLNRGVEGRNSPRPRLSDLRDSGRIEEEADEVLFLWTAEERSEGKDPLPVKLTLAKDRNGATGEREYLFHKSNGKLVEVSRREEPGR